MMRVQSTSDPLGAATNVTIPLPEPESDHFAPWDEFTALHQVGLGFVSAMFIDEPTSDYAGGRARTLRSFRRSSTVIRSRH